MSTWKLTSREGQMISGVGVLSQVPPASCVRRRTNVGAGGGQPRLHHPPLARVQSAEFTPPRVSGRDSVTPDILRGVTIAGAGAPEDWPSEDGAPEDFAVVFVM